MYNYLKKLRNPKRGLINLQNEDDKCILWCITRYLNPRKVHPERITKDDREFAKTLDFKGVSFPAKRNQIDRIEKQNNININIFGYDCDRESIYPLRISQYKNKQEVNLLHIEGKNKLDEDTNHYVLIKDFGKLMYNFTKHKDRKNFCMYCLQCFYSTES